MTPQAPQTPSSISHHPLKSTNLKSAGYDAASRTLEVAFTNGNIYRYHDVPAGKYEGLLGAPSAGTFFHARIRGEHTAEKVET